MGSKGYVGGKRIGSTTMCGLHPRAVAVGCDGARITYRFPCGHVRTETLKVGPVGRKVPAAPQLAARMAKWWSDGVSYQCPACLRAERAAAKKK